MVDSRNYGNCATPRMGKMAPGYVPTYPVKALFHEVLGQPEGFGIVLPCKTTREAFLLDKRLHDARRKFIRGGLKIYSVVSICPQSTTSVWVGVKLPGDTQWNAIGKITAPQKASKS